MLPKYILMMMVDDLKYELIMSSKRHIVTGRHDVCHYDLCSIDGQ